MKRNIKICVIFYIVQEIPRWKVKKLCTISNKITIAVISLLLLVIQAKGQQTTENQSCEKIIFEVPSLKCGDYKWDDQKINVWIKNNCIDKCDDPNTSGYAFSGKIIGTDKNNSLKVTITTNKEYLQPVRFNASDGTFKGTLYFDKTIQDKTIIKIMLRDSTRTVINTFIITLN